ncbi:MAG: prepilin-type N-terminal cleavage/methylation domain-containing protein [Pirellulaceae bacterium]|nr:prepilin-type N-terminal cleavage/methylation domain-containing protein [Planctomycetales bacterium]
MRYSAANLSGRADASTHFNVARSSRARRRGFSLLEVMISTGILAAGVVLLLGLLSNGEGHARRAEDRVIGQMLCQNRIDEIVSGVTPLQLMEPQLDPLYPQWQVDVTWQEVGVPGLLAVKVRATKDPTPSASDPGSVNAPRIVESTTDDASPGPRRFSYELVRWLRIASPSDPSLMGSMSSSEGQSLLSSRSTP